MIVVPPSRDPAGTPRGCRTCPGGSAVAAGRRLRLRGVSEPVSRGRRPARARWPRGTWTPHRIVPGAAGGFGGASRRTVRACVLTVFAATLVLGYGPAPSASANENREPPNPDFTAEITADQILARTAYLASDELAGRTGGTQGGRATEEYVAAEFTRFGLEPLGKDGGSFFQEVRLPFRAPQAIESWVEHRLGDGEPVRTASAVGPVPFGFSTEEEAQGELVFVGYGLRSSEAEFDEYADVDVTGKVVLCLRHGPNENDPESPWHLGGRNPRRGGKARGELGFQRKVQWAVKAGAAAILFVNDRHHEEDTLPVGTRGAKVPIPVMGIPHALADQLLAPTGKTHAQLQELIDAEAQPQSRAVPGVQVTVHPVFAGATARNVVAVRRGTDPDLAQECVLVGAHMDHIGYGWFGSPDGGGKMHNGADDNASGTAALLELAEALASGPPLKRSVVFAGWCGEEMGLVGSRLYTKEPLWPLERTITCVNMDMVGRYDAEKKRGPALSALGAPTGSGLKARVERLADANDLVVHHTWSVWRQSDHFPFYEKGVPALFVTTGLHPDYHRATDQWWKIESEPQARIAAMMATLVREIADAPERPEFKRRPARPILGVRLAPTEDGQGVRLIGVSPKLGAAKAGLKAGDRLVTVGGVPVAGMGSLGKALAGKKPGDTIEITYVRGKAEPVSVTIVISGSER